MRFVTALATRLRHYRWPLVVLGGVGLFVVYLTAGSGRPPPKGTVVFAVATSGGALGMFAIGLAAVSFQFGPGGDLVVDKTEGWFGRTLTTVLAWFTTVMLLGGFGLAAWFLADAWLAVLRS